MTEASPTERPRGYQGAERRDPETAAVIVALVDKAVATLREFYDSKFAERAEAVRILHDDMVRVPTLLDRAVASLKELIETEIGAEASVRDERFRAVEAQFKALELRARDLDEARATALIAALAAAKELVGAANTNFTKQIDGLQTAFTGQIKALDDKVNDLKDRITAFGSNAQGGQDARTNRRLETGTVAGIVAAAVAVLMLMGTIATVVLARPLQPAAPATSPQVIYAPAPAVAAPK